jgi:hypothetical protein
MKKLIISVALILSINEGVTASDAKKDDWDGKTLVEFMNTPTLKTAAIAFVDGVSSGRTFQEFMYHPPEEARISSKCSEGVSKEHFATLVINKIASSKKLMSSSAGLAAYIAIFDLCDKSLNPKAQFGLD